jgi:polysaccharide biosynthesis protein PelC
MKISLIKVVIAVIMIAATLVITGCKDDGPSSKVFVKNGTKRLPRVAILPFDAVGNVRSQDAGRVVTNTVITYLLSTGLFEVVDPGELDEAMVSNQIRLGEGLKKADLQAIQKALNVDAVIYGLVEEYGDVRVGNDSYPSVSFSARLINAHTGTIVWAGTISKTGADKVTLFDIGRISSMGKLCKAAVQDMARSMSASYDGVMVALADTGPSIAVASTDTHTAAPTDTTATPSVENPAATPNIIVTPAVMATPAPAAIAAGGKSADESKTYGEAELKALLPDIAGFSRGDFDYDSHGHGTLNGRYNLTGGNQFVEVKLVDYLKASAAASYVEMVHPGEDSVKFVGLTAFVKTSDFGYEHVDLAVGRFGLLVRGPAAKKDDVERAASALVAAIK